MNTADTSVDFTRMPGLYLKPLAGKGNGVFCRADIKAGDVIETTPVVFFSSDDATHIDKTNIYNYYFGTAFLAKEDKARLGCLALGMMSLCNHADDPNGVIEKTEGADFSVFRLKASRDIPKDSEIFISYGTVWFKQAD